MSRRPIRRRLLQYSLRTFLVLLTGLCIWLGLKTEKVRTQRRTARLVKAYGGDVLYGYQYDQDGPKPPGSTTPPGPKLLRMILGDDYFTELVSIEIENIADSDVAALAEQSTLRHLGVSGALTDGALEPISRLRRLEALEIRGGRFSGAGLDRLSDLLNLRALRLNDVWLSDEHAQSLGKLVNLRTLSLAGCRMGSRPARHLKSLCNLESLDLSGTLIGDEGLSALHGLKALRQLKVGGSMATSKGIKCLQAALPDARVDAAGAGTGFF